MEEVHTIKRTIDGAAAVTLPPCTTGWAYPIIGTAYHYAYAFLKATDAEHGKLWTGTKNPSPRIEEVHFEPTEPGWYRIGIRPSTRGALVTATYEGA